MNKYNVVYSTLTFNIKRLKEKLYRNQQKKFVKLALVPHTIPTTWSLLRFFPKRWEELMFSLILLRKKATASLLPWRRINEAAMDTAEHQPKNSRRGEKMNILTCSTVHPWNTLNFCPQGSTTLPLRFLMYMCTCLYWYRIYERNAFSNRSRRWGGAPVNLSSSQLEENRFFLLL